MNSIDFHFQLSVAVRSMKELLCWQCFDGTCWDKYTIHQWNSTGIANKRDLARLFELKNNDYIFGHFHFDKFREAVKCNLLVLLLQVTHKTTIKFTRCG